jgi:hypothetical protein
MHIVRTVLVGVAGLALTGSSRARSSRGISRPASRRTHTRCPCRDAETRGDVDDDARAENCKRVERGTGVHLAEGHDPGLAGEGRRRSGSSTILCVSTVPG